MALNVKSIVSSSKLMMRIRNNKAFIIGLILSVIWIIPTLLYTIAQQSSDFNMLFILLIENRLLFKISSAVIMPALMISILLFLKSLFFKKESSWIICWHSIFFTVIAIIYDGFGIHLKIIFILTTTTHLIISKYRFMRRETTAKKIVVWLLSSIILLMPMILLISMTSLMNDFISSLLNVFITSILLFFSAPITLITTGILMCLMSAYYEKQNSLIVVAFAIFFAILEIPAYLSLSVVGYGAILVIFVVTVLVYGHKRSINISPQPISSTPTS